MSTVATQATTSALEVSVQCGDAIIDSNGRALNISSSGCKLMLASPVGFGETVEIHFQAEETAIICEATVRSVRQQGDAQWVTGCTFTSEIDSTVADKLSTQAGIERRDQIRQEHRVELEVRIAGNPTILEAHLKDYSTAGARFACKQEMKEGSTIKLTLKHREESLDANATVVWREPTDEGFEYGCEWTNLNIQSVLIDWIGQDGEARRLSRRRRLISLAGSFAALGLGIVSWIILASMS